MSIGYLFTLTSRARWNRAAALSAVEPDKDTRQPKHTAAPTTDKRPPPPSDKPASGPAPK